jgi:D-alanine transaminase
MTEALATAYLNGIFLPLQEASISPLDRGFLFGDAAYEVIPVYGGRPLLLRAHLNRLARSLRELRIDDPLSPAEWERMISEMISRNQGGDQALYVQVTRGAYGGRDHRFPDSARPTVFAMSSRPAADQVAQGISAITLPDTRWGRCDIKSTALLANVLARQTASEAGANEAILIREDEMTEGATSSVIVVESGVLLRRPNGAEILPGTTTDFVVELASNAGLVCREERISAARLRGADEIWLTSAMRGIAPVVKLDGRPVGDGRPGPVWRQVSALFEEQKRAG